ncbi:hypothetical protein MKX01_033080 [Papaver californicum]|nr:hypothetical protein MKX01_033080 [Papaver californicum]
MAPDDDAATAKVAEETMVAETVSKPISTIVVIIAMQTEAVPLVTKFNLVEDPNSVVDSVGTVSASLITYASIQALQPDLIINAGTAGGFKVFDIYGVCAKLAFSTPNLLKELNLKVGKLSTGDSLDMSPIDEASITANDATVKDMEGAAVAYVTDLLSVPTIFVKAVTDIVDGDKPTAEEFLQNLIAVTAALDQAVTRVIEFVNGKCVAEL